MNPTYLIHAAYLGHDAGLAWASSVIMTENEAKRALSGESHALDEWQGPTLSGEWADDPTVTTLAYDVFGPDHTADDIAISDIADEWETAASEAFERALQGVALRTLGSTEEAQEIEDQLDQEAEVLKRKAGL